MNTLPEPVDSGLPGRTRAARGALSRNAKVRKISFTRSWSARFLHHFFVGSFSKPSHCKIFIVIQCPSDNDPSDYLLLPHKTFLMTALRSHSSASSPCALHPEPLHHTSLHDYPQPSSPRPQSVLPAAAIFLSPPPLRALRRSNLKNPLYKLTIYQNKNSFAFLLSQGCHAINRTKKLSLSNIGFTGQIDTSVASLSRLPIDIQSTSIQPA